MTDGVPVLQALRLSHVQDVGFAALRCSWSLGCPSELHPLSPSDGNDDRSQNERAYATAYRELFPNTTVPEVVGAHCSSQFAVSRDRIRERPLSDYQRYRTWLEETELADQISGRVIEYMWHSTFASFFFFFFFSFLHPIFHPVPLEYSAHLGSLGVASHWAE